MVNVDKFQIYHGECGECGGQYGVEDGPYPLVDVYIITQLWKDPPCLLGKLTISISMAIFNSYVELSEGKN